MNAQQLKKARTLLSKAGINEENKKDMVYSFTAGRTESLREMNITEASELIIHLEYITGQPEGVNERMKKKILAIAHEMNWHLPGGRKVDMPRINKVLEDKFGKPLDDLNYDTLPKAVTAFANIQLSQRKGF